MVEPPTTVTLTIPDEGHGARLDKFLATCAEEEDDSALTGLSRARLQRLIDAGAVLVDGARGKRATKLLAGQQVRLALPPPEDLELVPEPVPLDILYEDADLVVLNKPAGMVVHPGAGHAAGTLVHGLLHHCGDLSGVGGALRPGIVHRLDRGTSGVIVVAKNDLSHRSLAAQFAARRVKKTYEAFVRGCPSPDEGTFDTYFGRHPTHRKKFTSRLTSGKRAITHYRAILCAGGLAHLRIALETGRTHQIRVHLAERGHPIVGDPLYGGGQGKTITDAKLAGVAAALDHQALHAALLSFQHPRTGDAMTLKAPLPADLARLREFLVRLVEDA